MASLMTRLEKVMDVCKFCNKEQKKSYNLEISGWQSPSNHCKCYPIVPKSEKHTCIVCKCGRWPDRD